MNRASPADLRKALQVVDLLVKAGIHFVPMATLSPEDGIQLVEQADQRLSQLIEITQGPVSACTAPAAAVETPVEKPPRDDDAIVRQTIALAGQFYELLGYTHREGYRYWEASHPQERLVWEMACKAQLELTETDPMDALSELEDQ